MNKRQASELRVAIRRVVHAEVADAWKGGGDPTDIPAIEKELTKSRSALNTMIRNLTDKTDQKATKQKGFTLIELLIVIAIVCILTALIVPFFGEDDGTKCRGGYKFVDGYRDSPQVLDSQGHGIPCGVK